MSMSRNRAIMEECNYYKDARTTAARRGNWYEAIDKRKMTATVSYTRYEDEDGEECEEEVSIDVPFRYEVCGTCNGKGTHVNPSIDASGYGSYDDDCDYYEDEDGGDPYTAGHYDVTCYECKGEKVVPVINREACNQAQLAALEAIEEKARDDAEYDTMCLAEMRMGC